MSKKRKKFNQEFDLPPVDRAGTTINERSVFSPPNLSVDGQYIERIENFPKQSRGKFSSGSGCY